MNITKRIYDDFFRSSKISDYQKIIKCANENGYEFHTVLSFEDVIKNKDNSKKYLILRRDIDTADFKILRQMLSVEKKYSAKATYYFRLSTINYELMRFIEENNGEASYHYEELANFCYKHRIKDVNDNKFSMAKIQEIFVENFKNIKEKSGLPCLTIASHGDFINSFLKVSNNKIITDDIKKELGILREAYEKEHMSVITCRIADQTSNNFTQESLDAIERGENVIELLTHPRQWNSPIWINLKEEINRIYRGVCYKFNI